MDQLEAQKRDLHRSNNMSQDEEFVKQHITNFALRVFSMADDEDRAGKASKYVFYHSPIHLYPTSTGTPHTLTHYTCK